MYGKSICYFFILLCLATSVVAQETADSAFMQPDHRYDKDLLSPSFHRQRREALRDSLSPNSVAIFFANPIRNRSNDIEFEYHQDPNFYYLTGLIEPHAMLLIFKEPFLIADTAVLEILFVQDRNPEKETWNGKRFGAAGAKQHLLLDMVQTGRSFADMNIDFSEFDKIHYFPLHTDLRDDKKDRGDLYSLQRHFKRKTDTIRNRSIFDQYRLGTYMKALREVKTQEELKLMRKAISITCDAQKELMRAMEPGMTEYQSEAIVEYVFKNKGAEKASFPSILGGGENSCILHYTTNRKELTGNDLLVADIGAEYHGYAADVTRTIPVDGHFSAEEKIIYEIVLDAQAAAIAACKRGAKFWDPHDAATKVIQKRLHELGIIKKHYMARKYFMHGTSHYLGLDVHDAGRYSSLQPGNVITVEPGIYIPQGSDCDPKWWNIGVRIEDDILITDGAPEILSNTVPRKVEEIEALMKEESIFNKYK